jgi:enoyl-CoA hydratase
MEREAMSPSELPNAEAASSPEILQVDRSAGAVAVVRFDRPGQRNALSLELLRRLAETLDAFARDDEVRAVVLTGGREVFAAGGDIREMAASTPVEIWNSQRHEYWGIVNRFPKPLIAAVNGPAYGGGFELVLACDIVVAGRTASFALPEIRLGFVPGRGGTQRLPALAGTSLARFMVLTGEAIDARRALEAGIVLEICDVERTQTRAVEIGTAIAQQPAVAVRVAKELLRAAQPEQPLGLSLERRSYEFLVGTDDAREGMAAFLEKRSPRFTGC